MTKFISAIVGAILAVTLLSATAPAHGAILFKLSIPFPEDGGGFKPDPDGTPPWLQAEFEQLTDNLVRLTLTGSLSGNNEIKGGQGGGPVVQWGWGFNFNPAKTVSDLVFGVPDPLDPDYPDDPGNTRR